MKKTTAFLTILSSILFCFATYQPVQAAEQTVDMSIPGCGAASGISSILSAIDGVISISVDTDQSITKVVYDDAKAGVDQMETVINNNGYYTENISYLAMHTDITPQEAKDMISADGDFIILDVREPDEFCDTGNHIPGAVNYPWNSGILQQKYSELPVNKKIMVICGSGKRSHSAAEFLDSNNYTDVYDMTDGMKSWSWETEGCLSECMNLGDVDNDKKVGLPDIIFGLQYLSGLRDGDNKPGLQDIIIGLQILSGMRPCDILISEIAFADSGLRSCVLETGATYASEVTILNCRGLGLSDISGIEHLTNLADLNLFLNNITDINGLKGLTNLKFLQLGLNHITDITPLSSLVNLNILYMSSNNITDISALGSLIGLTHLDIMENNGITDVSALENLTDLTFLYLNRNRISDLTGLANLTKLTNLILYQNAVTDVTPLANLTGLEVLNLNNNDIGDITPLAKLTNLNELGLNNNNIRDITPLAILTNMNEMDLSSNDIGDVTPLANLINLNTLNLSSNDISTGVASLLTLRKATDIYLSLNDNIPCADLDALEAALGREVVSRPDSCIP